MTTRTVSTELTPAQRQAFEEAVCILKTLRDEHGIECVPDNDLQDRIHSLLRSVDDERAQLLEWAYSHTLYSGTSPKPTDTAKKAAT